MDLALFGIGVVVLLVLSILLVVLKEQHEKVRSIRLEARGWRTLYQSKREEANCLNKENCALREKAGRIPNACRGRCPLHQQQ